jgi:hypothetical protein
MQGTILLDVRAIATIQLFYIFDWIFKMTLDILPACSGVIDLKYLDVFYLDKVWAPKFHCI